MDKDLCDRDGFAKLRVGEMPDCRALDECMPRGTQRGIKANPHEAMVLRDRPAATLRHLWKCVADQLGPLRDKQVALTWRAAGEGQRNLLIERVAHPGTSLARMLFEPGAKTADAGNTRLCSRAFDIEHDFVAPEWAGREGIVVVGIGRRAEDGDVARSQPCSQRRFVRRDQGIGGDA